MRKLLIKFYIWSRNNTNNVESLSDIGELVDQFIEKGDYDKHADKSTDIDIRTLEAINDMSSADIQKALYAMSLDISKLTEMNNTLLSKIEDLTGNKSLRMQPVSVKDSALRVLHEVLVSGDETQNQ